MRSPIVVGNSRRSPIVRAMGLVEIFGDDAGAGNRRLAFRHQHRRGARGIERQKRLAPLPDPLFHQPQIEAVFAWDEMLAGFVDLAMPATMDPLSLVPPKPKPPAGATRGGDVR